MDALIMLCFPFVLSLTTTGISEDLPVQTPAFTDAVRLYRQSKGHYGTWDMMCGQPPQVRTSVEFLDFTHLFDYRVLFFSFCIMFSLTLFWWALSRVSV